jgi:hypothetical protein
MSPFVRGRIIPETESTGRAKRNLDVLLWLPQVSRNELAVLDFIEILRSYLSSITQTRCSINLWVPDSFSETVTGLAAIGIRFETVQKTIPTPKVNEELGANAPAEILEIAATALATDADVVVTSNRDWYPYATDFEKLSTVLADCEVLKRQCEIFVRGHDVPWSFDYIVWSQPWNGFYNLSEERTFKAGMEFLEHAHKKNLNANTQDDARMLVHNRLPNLCFTRDRLLFYDMQQSVSKRLGWERQEFLFEVGYYLNFYYLLLHGGFDHLALVVNGALGLGVAPKNVGATYARFLDALNATAPEIYGHFTEPRLVDFLERVAALRHFAAHRGSIAPGKIYEKLDPEPTVAQLDAEIARQDLDAFLHAVPDGPVREAFRATLRQKMLISMSKLLAEGIVFLQIRGKWSYIRPMSDIEWNFERYHRFMVAVLNALKARI